MVGSSLPERVGESETPILFKQLLNVSVKQSWTATQLPQCWTGRLGWVILFQLSRTEWAKWPGSLSLIFCDLSFYIYIYTGCWKTNGWAVDVYKSFLSSWPQTYCVMHLYKNHVHGRTNYWEIEPDNFGHNSPEHSCHFLDFMHSHDISTCSMCVVLLTI